MDPVVPVLALIALGIVGYFVWNKLNKHYSMPTKPGPKKANEDQDIPF